MKAMHGSFYLPETNKEQLRPVQKHYWKSGIFFLMHFAKELFASIVIYFGFTIWSYEFLKSENQNQASFSEGLAYCVRSLKCIPMKDTQNAHHQHRHTVCILSNVSTLHMNSYA